MVENSTIKVTLGEVATTDDYMIIEYEVDIKDKNIEIENGYLDYVSFEIDRDIKIDGKEVNKNKLEELLKTLKLENRRKHLPNELSGGQQQRVSIGRAIINSPAIMLADEPTGNLDSKASEEIISLLRLSNKKYNQTVIVITHDEKIALEADRVITIDDGKIIKDERNV